MSAKKDDLVPLGLQQVHLERVHDRALNPRKTYSGIKELAESMRSVGVLQPLVGRPHPTIIGGIELACGHRRKRGALEAGLATVPVDVRDLSDREMDTCAFVENIQREDVPLVEEAEALGRLHGEHGVSVDELATMLSKSKPWVYARLKIARLCHEAKDALRDETLGEGAAHELAKLEDKAEQREILPQLVKSEHHDAATARQARDLIALRSRSIAKAPFDPSVVNLTPNTPACPSCPKRSDSQADLLADAPTGDAKCLDRACWDGKKAAHTLVVIEKAKKAGKIVLSDEDASKKGVVSPHGGLSYDFADLKEKAYTDDGKETTIGAKLKKAGVDVEAVVVIVDGVAKEVVARKVVNKAQREESGAADQDKAQKEKAKRDEQKLVSLRDATVQALLDVNEQLRADFFLCAIASLAEMSSLKAVAERLGIGGDIDEISYDDPVMMAQKVIARVRTIAGAGASGERVARSIAAVAAEIAFPRNPWDMKTAEALADVVVIKKATTPAKATSKPKAKPASKKPAKKAKAKKGGKR